MCESGLPDHQTHHAHGVREGRALCELCCYDWEMRDLHDRFKACAAPGCIYIVLRDDERELCHRHLDLAGAA